MLFGIRAPEHELEQWNMSEDRLTLMVTRSRCGRPIARRAGRNFAENPKEWESD